MEELYVEGLATHGGPEPCVDVPPGRGEALVGVRAGRVIEPRNESSGVPTPSKGRKATSSAALSRVVGRTPCGRRTMACAERSCARTRDSRPLGGKYSPMNSNFTGTEPAPGAAHEEVGPGEIPLPPDRDRFYQPPRGYRRAKPGTVLRSRGVELGFLGVIPQGFTATQLLYRSTNLHGEPEVAVTTVLVPGQRDPDVVCRCCRISALSMPWRLAVSLLRAAPPCQGGRRVRAIGVPADRRGVGRRLGGVGARP
jgi:hypothetical protein